MASHATFQPARDVRGELLGVDETGRTLRRAAFLALLEGEAVTPEELARRAAVASDVAYELVGRGLATLGADGTVSGAAGLSRAPVPGRTHRLTVGDRAWWTWCAVDVVGIPAALGADAEAVTTCHHCGTPVHIAFRGGAVAEASHPEARLWNAEHVAGRSVAGGTCSLMNLFCSPAHLEAWRAINPDEPGEALDLAATVETGHAWWGALLAGRACAQEDGCR